MPIVIDIEGQDHFSKVFEAVRQGIAEANQVVGNLGSNAGAAFSTMAQQADAATKSTSALSRAFGDFFQQYTAANLALKGFYKVEQAIKQAGDTIMNFQSQQSMLGAILGETTEGIAEMTEQAKELGRTTVFTASQVSQLQIELSKLGFERGDIQNMTKDILAFAQATGGDLGDAAALTGAAIRMFGAQTDEASRYTNAMARATTASALNFQVIRDNLATFGPMAHSLGMEIEDVLALFGTLKNAGVEGSTAMTSLRNIFTKVAQGKVPGMEGGIKTLDEFISKLKQIDDMSPGDAMKKIGTRGGTQFMTLIQQADKILELRDKIKEASVDDTTGEMAEQMTNNVTGAIKMMESAWEGFILSFSESTGPWKDVIDLITQGITGLTNTIANGSTIDTEAIYAVMTGLGSLISMYGVKNGVMAVTQRLTAAQTAQYIQMAAALEAANNAEAVGYATELKSAVAKGILTEAQAARITSLLLESDSIAAKKKTEVELFKTEAAAIAQEIEFAEAQYAAASGAEKELWALWKKDAVMKQGAITQKITIAQTQAEAAANQKAAMMKMLNQKSTLSLTAAMDALGLSMLANPYVAAAAAIAGLAYVIYTAHSQILTTEKAQRALNDATEEHTRLLNDEENAQKQAIRTIQDKNASLYDQYKAYKDLTKARGIFAKYTQEELKNMSQEQIDALFSQENMKRTQQDVKSQLALLKEFKEWTQKNGATAAWSVIGEDEELERLGKKYGLDGYTKKLKETIGWTTNISDWIDTLLQESSVRAEETLKDSAYSGLSAGFTAAISDKELSKEASDIFNLYSKEGLSQLDAVNEAILTNEDRIKELKAEADRIKTDKNESNKSEKIKKIHDDVKKLQKENDELESSLESVGASVTATYTEKLSPAIEKAEKNVERLNKELLKAPESKKVEIKTQLDAAKKDVEILYALQALIDSNDKELALTLKVKAERDANRAALGEEGVVELGKEYEVLQKKVDGYLTNITKAQEISQNMTDKSVPAVQALASQYGLTTSKVESDFGKMEKEISAKIENMNKKYSTMAEGVEKNKLKVKIDKYNELLNNIKSIRTEMLSAVKSPYELLVNIKGRIPGWLADILGKAGFKIGANDVSRGIGTILNNAIEDKEEIERQKKEEEEAKKKEEEEKRKAASKEAAQRRKQQREYEALLDKQKLERERSAKDMEFSTRQAEIKAMEEGTEKTIAQIQLDFEKQEEAIKRGYEDLKRKKIEQAKQLFEKNPANKGKEFDPTSVDVSYTPEEQRNREMQEKENLTKRTRSLDEVQKKERQAMYEYLKEYGSMQQQKEAIAAEYEQKIQDESNAYQKAALEEQKERMIQELNLKELQDNINWEDMFKNMEYYSVSYLRRLKEQLRDALNASDIDAENAKVIVEKINEIEGKITEKTDVWGQIFPRLERRKQIVQDTKKVYDELAVSQAKQVELSEKVNVDRQKIAQAVRAAGVQEIDGIEVDLEFITEENYDKIIAALDAGSPLYDAIKGLFEQLGIDINKLTGEQENGAFKKRALQEQWGKLKDIGNGKVSITDLLGVADTANPLSWAKAINTNVQGLSDFVDHIGVGGTEFGEAVHSFADGCNSFNNVIGDLMSGNVFGAVTDTLKGFESIGNMFNSGGAADKYYERDMQALTASNEHLQKAIDRLAETMKDGSFLEVEDAYKKTLEQLAQKQINTQEQLERALDDWQKDDWKGQGHIDSAYQQIREGLSEEDKKKIDNILGKDVYTRFGLEDLTSEEMAKLRDSLPDVWEKMLGLAEKGFRGSDAARYMEDYAAIWDEMLKAEENRINAITGVSFDDMRDSFRSTLLDMEADSEDASQNISKIMSEALVDNLINTEYKKKLEGWVKEMSQAIEENDEAQMSLLKKEYQSWVDEAKAKVGAINDVTGYDPKYEDKKATANMAEKATYDQFELYLGIAMSQQIALEQGNDVRCQILDTLTVMQQISSLNGAVTAEIRNLVQTSNEYLLDIKKSNRQILDNFGEKMDNMYNLIDERL